MRFFYTLLLYALAPLVLARLAWRARRQRGYLEHLAERFGRYAPAPAEPVIWVHAVSVGETRAAEPLIHALRERHPRHRILLTHMTPTGREAGRQLFGRDVIQCYLPYDYPGAVARFLDHFRPHAGIVMETEIWPNLIRACGARAIPVCLVNARLSEKSLAGYRRFAGFTRASLEGLSAIAAQTAQDAQRFAALGATRVHVTGSIKFDVAPPPQQLEQGRSWRQGYGAGRRVLLAASTREGEEALLLEVVAGIEARVPGLLMVLVPRHPQRFDEVARMLEERGIRYQRRSGGDAVSQDARVLLGDSMGEMFAYYAAADVVFMGGSLLPFGCHNLIEACAVGAPVLVGPSTYNFAEAVRHAVAVGAARQVPDAAALATEAGRLLLDAGAARRMGEAGVAFCAAHRGATERVLELIRLRNP
jgi:3-deoxy-D-manno-octulosonic-acid transferase